MNKKILILLNISLILTLCSCYDNEGRIITQSSQPVTMPIETLGNQLNVGNSCMSNGWIYLIENISDSESSIVRFRPDDVKNKEVILQDENQKSQISVSGDWIYFISQGHDSGNDINMDLYKVNIDGSKRTIVANMVFSYTLTENEVYYDSGEIYAVDLGGEKRRKILADDFSLLGVHNEYIYYEKYIGEDITGPYRLKLDGTEAEMLLDPRINTNSFIAENDYVYFAYTDEKNEENSPSTSIIKKKNGTEIILTVLQESDSSDLLFNKEDEWFYYSEDSSLYRMKSKSESEKELVYKAKYFITSFLLYDGDILINTAASDSKIPTTIYIGKDGQVIDLSKI